MLLEKLKIIASAAALCAVTLVAVPQTASAESITVSNLGDYGYLPRIYQSDTSARYFDYALDFDLDNNPLNVEADRADGTVRVFGTQTGKILANDRTTVLGITEGSLDILFTGVKFDQVFGGEQVYALGIEGHSTSSGTQEFTLDFFDLDLPDQHVVTDVYGGFAPAGHRRYSPIDQAFNFVIADFGNGGLEAHAWIKSTDTFALNGLGEFAVHGDIHGLASDAEVPEPSTILLLGAGVLGLALRKRKAELS